MTDDDYDPSAPPPLSEEYDPATAPPMDETENFVLNAPVAAPAAAWHQNTYDGQQHPPQQRSAAPPAGQQDAFVTTKFNTPVAGSLEPKFDFWYEGQVKMYDPVKGYGFLHKSGLATDT